MASPSIPNSFRYICFEYMEEPFLTIRLTHLEVEPLASRDVAEHVTA